MTIENQRTKPAMVLLHGLLSDRRLWTAQIAQMAASYHVFDWDMPGFGSEPPLRDIKTTRLDAISDWLALRLSGEGLDGAYLAGYSFGCTVALNTALRHPGAVGRLGLVAGSANWGGGLRAIGALLPGPSYTFLRFRLRRYLKDLLPAPEPLETALAMVDGADPATGRALLAEILKTDLTPRLGGLRVPVLVVSGGRDPLATRDRADALAQAIPGAKRLLFPDGGHYICITHAQELARALVEFGLERRSDGT